MNEAIAEEVEFAEHYLRIQDYEGRTTPAPNAYCWCGEFLRPDQKHEHVMARPKEKQDKWLEWPGGSLTTTQEDKSKPPILTEPAQIVMNRSVQMWEEITRLRGMLWHLAKNGKINE